MFSTTLVIKNTTQKLMIFEFFLPKFEIAGLKLTPMVERIKAEESLEINIEYQSFFKKISKRTIYFSLQDKFLFSCRRLHDG